MQGIATHQPETSAATYDHTLIWDDPETVRLRNEHYDEILYGSALGMLAVWQKPALPEYGSAVFFLRPSANLFIARRPEPFQWGEYEPTSEVATHILEQMRAGLHAWDPEAPPRVRPARGPALPAPRQAVQKNNRSNGRWVTGTVRQKQALPV